ncbi:MAG TPA: type II toxin-antitoxin system HipA family toxin [Bacteroidia bacterium]|nr:type II toxin-antitoxin system HipA family toxin [Bacteroidia bacterium]
MNVAEVKIWETFVGAVAWDEQSGTASFEYAPSWLKNNVELAPLKMPLLAKKVYSFPELRPNRIMQYDTFKGLPGLLADALPDKYGNQLINQWLAHQGRPQNSLNPIEMLCFIGSRGMGALEFEPNSIKENKNTFTVEINSLVEIAQKLLYERSSFNANLQHEDEKAIMDILKIGTSAGGARPKAVIAYNEKTGEVKSGQTKAPQGFEHWIIKLDGVSDVQLGASKGYGRVEMAYYLMAKDCGINMMPSTLLEEKGRAHFMTKRFDRSGNNTKHHIQTFCALKHFDFNLVNSFSYEQLFQTMRELKLNYQEIEQMYRRMVFNVLAKNCDDHTKNFSFILKQNSNWELAPAYDICHAYRPGSEWVSQHALSINNKRNNINRHDLLTIANQINCKKSEHIISEVQEVILKWKKYAKAVEVHPKLTNAIANTMVKV